MTATGAVVCKLPCVRRVGDKSELRLQPDADRRETSRSSPSRRNGPIRQGVESEPSRAGCERRPSTTSVLRSRPASGSRASGLAWPSISRTTTMRPLRTRTAAVASRAAPGPLRAMAGSSAGPAASYSCSGAQSGGSWALATSRRVSWTSPCSRATQPDSPWYPMDW